MVQFCCRGADQQGGVPVDLHACFRGLDRRLKGLFPGTAAEVFQCDTHSVHLTRNRNRGCADDVAVLHNPGPGEEVRGHSFSGKRIVLGVQSDGDRIPKSIAWTFPEGASWISMCPPPPMPLIQGSSTETVKAVATAASTALPPSASTFAPAGKPVCAGKQQSLWRIQRLLSG